MAISGITARGAAEHAGSAASVSVSPTAALAVDKELIVTCVGLNADTTSGDTTRHVVTDSKGHTWEKVFEKTQTAAGVAEDGSTTSKWRVKVTTQIETTDSITNTYQGGNQKTGVINIVEATVDAGNTLDWEPSAVTAFVNAGSSESATLSGLTNREYLFYGLLGVRGDDPTKTPIANYTERDDNSAGGGANPEVSNHTATRILTGTGDTWTSSALAAALTAGVQTLTGFYEVATGGGSQSLTGALFTKAPTFFTGAITSVRALTGVLFTKAPTFPTGVITATRALTGVLFTKAPTFFTGTVTTTRTLTGVLFSKAPTFPTGAVSLAAGPQTLTGSLFAKAPTFPTGTVAASYALTGTLFVKAPTFPQGAVTTGAVTLTGTLFVKAPTFPQGAVTTGAVSLTGVLFQKAPTFFTGTVTAGAINLTGTLFTKAPIFFTGTIGQAGTLFGTLYVNTPVFFTGTMGQLGGSFWRPNPVAYTLAPVGYTPIGPNDIPPWGIDIEGVLFVKAPMFPVGTVS